MKTIAVIGGGAAGMIAALTASENPENHVLLFERQERIGRKLLSTGNGRCNLSNRNAEVQHYFGSCPEFVAPALAALTVEDTLALFRGLGLITKTEPDGRIYPNSNQAAGVLDILRFSLERDNITILTETDVTDLDKKQNFLLKTTAGRYSADAVILTCGGMAAPKLGGCDRGYALLRKLGHRIVPLSPALVQLKTDSQLTKSLKGIKADAAVRLISGKKLLAEHEGEVLFTEYGISGPAIFTVSRHLRGYENNARLELDLLPGLDAKELFSLLSLNRRTTCENLLTGFLSKRLGQVVVKAAGIPLSKQTTDLTDAEKNEIITCLKQFILNVKETTGFANAQVTAGGADVSQFDAETLQSRIVPGLYAAGEVLDIDGDCGGYNLQWAWSSGRLAGRLL